MKNVMKILLSIVFSLVTALSLAQDSNKRLYKIYINHADPFLIYQMLSGLTNFNTPPEMSTLMFNWNSNSNGSNGSNGNGGFGNSGPGRPNGSNGSNGSNGGSRGG